VCLVLLLALLVVLPAFAGTPPSASLSQSDFAALPDSPGATKLAAAGLSSAAEESSSKANILPDASPQLVTAPPAEKIQWKPMLLQSLEFTVFNHAWRAAWDPGLRYLIAHKPFWHDYGVSLTDYHMDHWSDGDDFVVNDVGHPLEGAVFGRLFLQNDPKSFVEIGRNNAYWKTRLQSLAWMTLWSTQFEIGPLSETDIGNQGGYYYSIGCGTAKACLTTPPYSAGANKYTGLGGVTNNTGWTDFIVTPVLGLGWVVAEDTIDRYIVTPVAREHRIIGGRILRSALEPTRSMGALFAGKFPWMLPAPENNFVYNAKPKPVKPPKETFQRWELGTQYTYVSLPVLTRDCPTTCREGFSGMGTTFTYNFTHGFAFDSSTNFLPGQNGSQGMMQGLYGIRLGPQFHHVGVFGKVRPGFIYYKNAIPGGGDDKPNSLTRFAWDMGGIVEVYPGRESRSVLRFDVGTTLVRYLTDRYDDRFTQIGGVISNQYWVTQGNFQFSTGYTYRF
jgi:hypothetical protein